MGNRCRCIYVFSKLTGDPAATGLLSPLIRMTTTGNENPSRYASFIMKNVLLRDGAIFCDINASELANFSSVISSYADIE